jgi:hypothetical protein
MHGDGGNRDREEASMEVQRVLREATFSLNDLAEDMEGSYGTLRQWAVGSRVPTPENMARIAAALEMRAKLLVRLAADLRKASAA